MSNKIIYLKGYPTRGEIIIAAKNRASRKIASLLSRSLIVAGLSISILLLSPFIFTELQWRLGNVINHKDQSLAKKYEASKFGQVIQVSDLEILNPIDADFSLVIPKIRLNSPIVAKVSVDDEKNYESALKKGVAHAQGSFLPGENGSIYLFGHSSYFLWDWKNSKPVFYLLKDLDPGDEINIVYQQKRFVYKVSDKKTISDDDLSVLRPETGEEKLILQTCWPPGTAWKNLVVIASRV